LISCDFLKCVLKVPLNELKIPDSIKGVLAARLDALSPEKKHLIQIASVIGREFSMDLLKPLVEMPGNLFESLKALEREKIVKSISATESERYQFRQQLMQELAYQMLLRRERRRYHHMVGESIETLYRQNLKGKFGLLSHHFYKAQDWAKAFEYSRKAAEQAMNSLACNEALTYIDRAVEILSKSRWEQPEIQKLELYQKKGETLFNLGQMESAQTIFNTILSESRHQEQREAEAETLFRLGWIAFYRHKPKSAQKLLKEAIHLSNKENFRETLLKAKAFLGFVCGVLGNLDQAGSLLIESFQLGENLDTIDGKAWSLVHLIRYYNWIGEFKNAIELIRQLNVLNRKIRSPYFKILIHCNQGSIFIALGRIKTAKKSLETGLKQLETGNHKFWRPRLLNTLGWAYAESGEYQEAVRLNKQSLKRALDTGDQETIQNAQINIGENYLAMGNIDKAEVILKKAWQQIKNQGVSYTRWRYTTRLMIAMGDLYYRKEDRKKSLYFIRKALNMAQKSGAKKHQAKALLVRGKLLAKTRPNVAEQSFQKALDLSQEMGTRLLTKNILHLKNNC
jgi:tetratricopeptide (TPR) repeat protein